MSSALATRAAVQLQPAINHAHKQVLEAAGDMVDYAVKCGTLLLQAKEQVELGGWSTWVDDNFDGSRWVARKYMQLASSEIADPGSVTSQRSIGTALRHIATPRQQQIETAIAPDPDSDAGRLLDAAKAYNRETHDVIDAEVVEIAPSGVAERKWNTTLKRWDAVRQCMNEAVRTELTSDATAQALQDASIVARQIAVELEQMAQSARRRVA